MRKIELQIPYIAYPVGQYMKGAVEWGKLVAQALLEAEPDIGQDRHRYLFLASGSSGSILASCVAAQLPYPPDTWYVKKPEEQKHGRGAPIIMDGYRVIWIDDFVGTGETFWRCHKELRSFGVSLYGVITRDFPQSILDVIDIELFIDTYTL